MSEIRRIEYSVVYENKDYVVVVIMKQTHLGHDFTPSGCEFYANGFSIASHEYPSFNGIIPRVWVRGSYESKDFVPITLPRDVYTKFAATVHAYNKKYGAIKPTLTEAQWEAIEMIICKCAGVAKDKSGEVWIHNCVPECSIERGIWLNRGWGTMIRGTIVSQFADVPWDKSWTPNPRYIEQ